MFKKFDLNWHAVWRKAVGSAVFASLMGYLYVANKRFDEAVDAEYPAPSKQVTEEDEAPAS